MRTEYLSMKEIGALYGVSSHVVGRALKDAGLRTPEGKPSSRAFEEDAVTQRHSDDGDTYFWIWDVAKVTPILERAGLTRVSDATADPG
jgi:hypothetical protein